MTTSSIALRQIIEKGYKEQFIREEMGNPDIQIIGIGVNFSSEKRNIEDWRYEKI